MLFTVNDNTLIVRNIVASNLVGMSKMKMRTGFGKF